MAPSGFLAQTRAELAPSVLNPLGFGSTPGSIATPMTRSAVEAADTEPAGTVGADALRSGANVSAGKEFADEGGGNSLSMGAAATSPPAQSLSLLAVDHGGSTRLLSPAEPFPSANSLTFMGAGQISSNAGDWSDRSHRTMAGMIGIAGAIAGVNDGGIAEWPGPSALDLIAAALPFDRAALDRAIDQFFHQVEELNASDLVGQRPAHIVFYTLALASTFAALDVVSRRRRQAKAGKIGRVRNPLVMGEPVGFPELPGSWSSRLS